ncbi:PPC domain-containing protein [Aliikangiella maris]|uniref:PPC domain-containing protein n=2 Tax=Aliikangiella maris TaxID=3162458 RepID=A0ABV3MKH7_9GAMM
MQSARYNPETDSNTTPFADGHGHQDTEKQWRTVMSYNYSLSCPRINWWSNPNKTRNGRSMGTTAKSNNTRILNYTSPTIAGFRDGGTTPPPPPPGNNELENGVAINNLEATKDNELNFTMPVPADASNILFEMSGGSGDADLYVKFGSKPTNSSYDCRPYKNGNVESCSFNAPAAGTWYIDLYGYSIASGVSLNVKANP